MVIDDRGRIVVPSRLRKELKLRRGDAFMVVGLRDDLIVLKKIDVEKMLRDIAEEVTKAGLEISAIEREIEEEANELAKQKIHD
ncbi:AbrB family transcriptional regulator [Ignicoccus islandicus DSM 13165]|uniref:AbrB family transcriptional regulator n=1 Tax=Ignicoccus islandicus DSM 13165 TaxID=940295 RepID=A0A0U3F5X4_9CREN|nr:AbrB/MazE/SpoVT family DNA-binding domain-containing protein [Ignicoccus islandicus]ALU11480.1 AbrB family transcriptional regulator [Ignicoccus islandicus DSM 13165]